MDGETLSYEYVPDYTRVGVHVCAICNQPLRPGLELAHYEAHRGRTTEILVESTSFWSVEQ